MTDCESGVQREQRLGRASRSARALLTDGGMTARGGRPVAEGFANKIRDRQVPQPRRTSLSLRNEGL